ncbi:MAG: peroxiredoxin [Gemmataceae bacterium]|nr:peroxiredoxin [Gemmataceae bacterium]
MNLLFKCAALALAVGVAFWAVSGAARAGDKKLKVGDKLPALTSVDENGKTWKSSSIVGKKILVLYFYPADFTGGCTKQACGFRDDIEKLGGQGVEVVGVSADSPKTHDLFKKHHKLNFTLLADEQGELAKMFGINVGKGGKAKGVDEAGNAVEVVRNATIARVTVVVDRKGAIAAIDTVKDAGGDSKRIAELVKNLEK